MVLSAQRVADAVRAWRWVPPDARSAATDEYELIGYPPGYGVPTQLTVRQPVQAPDGLLREVGRAAADWGRSSVGWWLDADAADPLSLAVRARPGRVAERVQVLAYDLTAGLPDLDVPADVEAGLVRDERTLRAADLVSREVWGGAEPSEDDTAERVRALSAEPAEQSTFVRAVCFVDGDPASTGGMTFADDVARLWGAATRPRWRGRGAYRAVLAERLALARRRDAAFALVSGRAETSAPILRRAGFADFGLRECYEVEVAELVR